MNVHERKLRVPEVTTGPLPGSRKVYSSPEGRDDISVPFREIGLSDGATFRVYDTSGPYTDPEVEIDVRRGLAPVRAPWIEARGGVEAYEGRVVKPEDNGDVAASHLAREFHGKRRPLRGIVADSSPPP